MNIVSNGFFIPGGLRGRNLLVSFGTKFDIMFKGVSVNVLTCQLGPVNVKVLMPKKTETALLKCRMVGGILKLIL